MPATDWTDALVVFLGSASFDGSPVDVSGYTNAIGGLPGAKGFDTMSVGDRGCAVVAVPRHRLDEKSCLLLEHGPLIVAGSVRLHNHAELAASLAVAPQRNISSGNLVARAFEKWGPGCASRLYGEFGFVVWNRSHRVLYMVSDHIRSVRLFTVREGGRVLFSNNLEALQKAAREPLMIDPATVADFLKRPVFPARHTFFSGVVSAQPGAFTEISAKAEKDTVWWYPLENVASAKMDAEECEAAFSHHVTAAVAHCVSDDAVFGSHLTGGIDSGAVSLLASELLRESGRNLKAVFSWTPHVSDENPHLGPADERNFLEAFARKHECNLVLGNTSAEDYRTFLRLPFELLGTADVVDELATINSARYEGVEVMLSGWGGDEAFSAHGFGYLPWLLAQGRVLDLTRALRRLARSRNPRTLLRLAWREAIVPHMPDSLYPRLRNKNRAFENNCYRSTWLADFAQRDTELELAMRVVTHPYEYAMRLFSTAYPGDRVETWRNWAAGSGLQYRYPLLDRALLEFIFSVPPDIAFGGGARSLAGRHFTKRLPGGLHKNDAANEARRARTRQQCWALLRDEVEAGAFDAPCDYVDTDRLKKAILWAPKQHDAAATLHFAELTGGVRGFYLSQRGELDRGKT